MALTTKQHNKTVSKHLKPGDRLEAPRKFYSHYGIYVGNGQVVHRTGEGHGIGAALVPKSMSSPCGVGNNKAKVRKTSFEEFAGDTPVYIKNCSNRFHPKITVSEACGKIGDEGYNLFWRNCEHFSNWCQTGMESSSQVENLVVGLAVVGGVLMVGGFFWVASSLFTKKEKEGTR